LQKFIELLRKGTAEDRDSAIECLRTALAPCALDAYPVSEFVNSNWLLFVVFSFPVLTVGFVFKEAYEEFKHVLLAFIYDKDDKTSPVANEVSVLILL